MFLLIFAAFFAHVGRVVANPGGANERDPELQQIFWLTIIYSLYIFLLLMMHGAAFQDLFKLVSPFIFFLLVASVSDRGLPCAIAASGLIGILANAMMFPLDYGWTYWGNIRTFKGFYYFKTDLAYAICFSLLFFVVWVRYKLNNALILLLLICLPMIFYANSRMNYLVFATLVLFILHKNGKGVLSYAKYGLVLLPVIVAILYVYDSNKLLGFDTANEGAFTQGRNVIWDVLITRGIAAYSLPEWLFGRGLWADMEIYAKHVSTGEIHNAHNEWLHLVVTQGLIGCLLYIGIWARLFINCTRSIPPWARGTGVLALLLIGMQSMTGLISPFATKTWPFVMVLLMLRSMRQDNSEEAN